MLTHPNIVDNWFKESPGLWKGQAMSLQVVEILHTQVSKYQDILLFKSLSYGNVLVLDGLIQATERDEFAYQEMIAHLPLNSHPLPQHVLVIGGGDAGVLREVVKHDSVLSVTLVEIDEVVVQVAKKYLPSMAIGFMHPKVKVHIGDGFDFLKNNTSTYDVIITDSSDPIGPAKALFTPTYYSLMKDALLPQGIICTQGTLI